MFLLYTNDIDCDITSTIRFFADDCIVYRTINTEDDAQYLQQDLDTISSWSNTWQMELNIEKCATLRCARSRCNTFLDPYIFHVFCSGYTTFKNCK